MSTHVFTYAVGRGGESERGYGENDKVTAEPPSVAFGRETPLRLPAPWKPVVKVTSTEAIHQGLLADLPGDVG